MRLGNRLWLVVVLSASVLVLAAPSGAEQASAPGLSVQYEELTAPDFIKAVAQSGATCVIPLGILEKHGPHLPLGTDLLDVRETCLRAARKEYTIVFPPYFIGQIFEARHQPGTIAYSPETIMTVLQETCDELARNGIKKIILVNGHGGNDQFAQYFCQAQLAKKKDYAVFLFDPSDAPQAEEEVQKLRKTTVDGHAGEGETSSMLAHRPDLVHLDRAQDQTGADQGQLAGRLKHAYTGIWWYAKTPNHYLGTGAAGNKALGEKMLTVESGLLAEMIRSVKQDTKTLELQRRFFEAIDKPLETSQTIK